MAITINQKPEGWVYARNKVVFVSSSGNVANTGFRYVYEVEIAGVTTTYLIPPNPSDKGILELSAHLQQYLGPRIDGDDPSHKSIHELGIGTATLHVNELASNNATTTVQLVSVTVKEGWIISGVFTPTAVGQATASFVVQNGGERHSWHFFNYPASPGTQPANPLSQRLVTTGARHWEMGPSFGFPAGNSAFIPTNNDDYHTIHFITDDGTYTDMAGGTYKIRGVIYAEDGTPTTKTINITSAAGQITHFGCGPKNLRSSSIGAGFFNPDDYPNYRAYAIDLTDNANNPLSDARIFFPMEYHAKAWNYGVSRVQITWLNDYGGWDYFNFDFKGEITQKAERKRMRQVVGTYADTTFSISAAQRGVSETNVMAERTYALATRPLDESEFVFLSSLFRSSNVYIITDVTAQTNAGIYPVVIETTDNIEYRPLDSKLRTLTITAKEAHPVIS